MIDSLIAKGIEPMVTLHHFSHPIWFEDKGGFTTGKTLSISKTIAPKSSRIL